jgi:hypothetical protein
MYVPSQNTIFISGTQVQMTPELPSVLLKHSLLKATTE